MKLKTNIDFDKINTIQDPSNLLSNKKFMCTENNLFCDVIRSETDLNQVINIINKYNKKYVAVHGEGELEDTFFKGWLVFVRPEDL